MRGFAFCFQGILLIWVQEIMSDAEIMLRELSCQQMWCFLRESHNDTGVYWVCFFFLLF